MTRCGCRQGLEFVFEVMGSGFASPALLRVMKDSASRAADHEAAGAALLSLRYKKRRGDGMGSHGGGEASFNLTGVATDQPDKINKTGDSQPCGSDLSVSRLGGTSVAAAGCL